MPVSSEGLDELANDLLKNPVNTDQTNTPNLNVQNNINKSDYIVIPNTDILISREELYKGKTWNDAHYALQENGLFMPTPAIFMDYFLKVKEAEEGKISLNYSDGNPLNKKEAKNLWKYLTTNFDNGCWTWLDSLFKKEKNKWYIYTDHKVVKKNNNKELAGNKNELEQCLREDAYVTLDFNKQGLPKTRSSNQNYQQGNNIYFYHPKENSVARFNAYLDRAGLNCVGDPSDSISVLGVFACARGSKKND